MIALSMNKYVLVILKAGAMERRNIDVPEGWKKDPRRYVETVLQVDLNSIVVFIPLEHAAGLVRLLSR